MPKVIKELVVKPKTLGLLLASLMIMIDMEEMHGHMMIWMSWLIKIKIINMIISLKHHLLLKMSVLKIILAWKSCLEIPIWSDLKIAILWVLILLALKLMNKKIMGLILQTIETETEYAQSWETQMLIAQKSMQVENRESLCMRRGSRIWRKEERSWRKSLMGRGLKLRIFLKNLRRNIAIL